MKTKTHMKTYGSIKIMIRGRFIALNSYIIKENYFKSIT